MSHNGDYLPLEDVLNSCFLGMTCDGGGGIEKSWNEIIDNYVDFYV